LPRPKGAPRFHTSSAKWTVGMVYEPLRSKSDQTSWKCSISCWERAFSLERSVFFCRMIAMTRLRQMTEERRKKEKK